MGDKITARQVAHFVTIAEQKGLNRQGLQSFYDLGLVATIFDVEDPTAIDIDALRTFLGLPPLRLIFEIDYDTFDFEAAVAAGHYDWRNSDLNERNFPVKGKGRHWFEARLFDAGCSSKDGVTRIATADKVNPWRPAETEHILAFGAKFPTLQLKHPIVGLGSAARMYGTVFVPCLYRLDAERGLDLYNPGRGLPVGWRLLGVREISAPVD